MTEDVLLRVRNGDLLVFYVPAGTLAEAGSTIPDVAHQVLAANGLEKVGVLVMPNDCAVDHLSFSVQGLREELEELREQVRELSRPVRVGVQLLDPDACLPEPSTAGSAGLDLEALPASPVEIKPGERVLIPTGLALEVPHGYEVQIRPRSGNALRRGLTVLNSPGTIDSDYRGEVGVLLVNLGDETQVIQRGDFVAQAVVARVQEADLEVRDRLSETTRGQGGFGSTDG